MSSIEFGCGPNPRKPGFLTCDMRDLPGVNYVCPAWEIGNYVKDGTVDEIFSRHFFEHLTFKQGDRVMQIWFDLLKPGGKCGIMIPNMDVHIQQWVTGSNLWHARAGFWGHQNGTFEELWDVHKSGYNRDHLAKLMIDKGFKNIKSLQPENSIHLHLEGTK